jgi:hypothetical protein
VVCYVPIDSNYPDARVNLIIEDAAKIHIGYTFNNTIKSDTVFLSIADIRKEIGLAKRAFKHKSTS